MPKEKGLYKRGNVWWLRYADPYGKIQYESSKSASFKAAQSLLIQRKKEVLEGNMPIPTRKLENHSFLELSQYYLEWAQRQKSFSSKQNFVKQLIKTFGNCPLRGFNTRMIEEYQTKILSNGRAPATANRHLATIKHMFTKAVEWDMTEEAVSKRIKRVKLLPENNKRLRYLSIQECQTLVEACCPHLRPIVITALNSGMRREEILSLEWEKHVDLKHGFILLDITKNGERREIPINQELRRALSELPRRLDSPHVFTDKAGSRYRDIKKSYKSALRKAGIKDFRFHDLRHTFASHLVMAGVDIITVKELLGHKTLTMTLRYAHLAPGHKVKAVELLGNSIRQKTNYTKTIQFTKKGANQQRLTP